MICKWDVNWKSSFLSDWMEDVSDLMARTLNLSEEIVDINVSNEFEERHACDYCYKYACLCFWDNYDRWEC